MRKKSLILDILCVINFMLWVVMLIVKPLSIIAYYILFYCQMACLLVTVILFILFLIDYKKEKHRITHKHDDKGE